MLFPRHGFAALVLHFLIDLGLNINQKVQGIDNDEYDKDSAADFVLWKAWKNEDRENYWEESFEIQSEGEKKETKIIK